MSYPKSVIVVITCHGVIQIEKSNNQPKLFKIPNDMKIVKLSAVTPGVCNMTIDDDVNEFIDLILDKKKKKEMKEGLENPEKYAKTLGELYKKIEKETVENLYTESPDSNTILRKTFIQHRDKSYKIVTYNQKHPNMINKEYVRNNKNEQNSSKWDYGIYCLNVNGKPDLITKIKGRTYRDKDTSIFLNEIIDFLHQQGVKEVILVDLSCSNFEYEVDEKNSETSVSERNTRSIRSNLIKEKLNGGGNRKKGTIKKRGLLGGRKTRRQKSSKNRKSTITRKDQHFKHLKNKKNIKGAGKKEDIQKILEVYKTDQSKRLLVFKLLRELPEETVHDLIIGVNENPNYLNEWIHEYSNPLSFYYGKTKNGLMNGKGKLIKIDGDILEGDWIDNNLNGKGKVTSALNGAIIEGNFKDGDLNGPGKIKYENGTFVEGEFKNTILNGQGKFTYPNGTIAEGEFYNAKLIKGKKTYANGDIYEGDWIDNNLNGKGKVTSAINGAIIEGNFKDGDLNGPGKIKYENGTFVEGEFKNTILNGQGKFTYPNGTIAEGEFYNAKLIEGKRTHADGSVYEGSFKDNKRDGLGKFTDPADGTVYEGQWKNGKRYGQGTQSNSKGEIYQGNFKKGQRHGEGTMKWEGNEKTGTWYKDRFKGNNI